VRTSKLTALLIGFISLVAVLAASLIVGAEEQTTVVAAADSGVPRLSLEQTLELALQANPNIIITDLAVKEAELRLKEAQVNLRITVTPQQLEEAQAALEAARAEALLTRQAQMQTARERYISVLKAQHTLRLAHAGVEQAERQLALVRERLSAGLATDTDLYLAEDNLRRAQITLRQSQASLESERIRFNLLLSRDLRADFELIDDIQSEIPSWDLEADTDTALANRLDIQVLERSLELAKRNLAAADPSYTPKAQIERLEMAVEKAQIALEQARARVILETRDAILNLEMARIQADLAAEAFEHQQRLLQVAVLRHENGLITAGELMDAQAAANAAEIRAVQALYDQALAVTRYLNAIGADILPVAKK
jgi:outer membrane protein TolC